MHLDKTRYTAGPSMSDSFSNQSLKLALPLLSEEAETAEHLSASEWHGWTPLTPLSDSPEPVEPQGAYSRDAAAELVLETVPFPLSLGPVELFAPAGGPE